jgi:hypothetical protein
MCARAPVENVLARDVLCAMAYDKVEMDDIGRFCAVSAKRIRNSMTALVDACRDAGMRFPSSVEQQKYGAPKALYGLARQYGVFLRWAWYPEGPDSPSLIQDRIDWWDAKPT